MPYCKANASVKSSEEEVWSQSLKAGGGKRPADVGKGFEFGYAFLLKREEACSPPVSSRSLKEATLSFDLDTWQLGMRT